MGPVKTPAVQGPRIPGGVLEGWGVTRKRLWGSGATAGEMQGLHFCFCKVEKKHISWRFWGRMRQSP